MFLPSAMNEQKRKNVLQHSKSSIAIPVNSLDTKDQTFPTSHSERNWARRTLSSLYQCIPGVMNPRSKTAQIFSKLFIFLFSFLLLLQTITIFVMRSKQDDNCIINITTYGAVWSILLDYVFSIIFVSHITFRFRLAYVSPESRALVYNPKKVALNYLFGYFVLDFFLAIPIPDKVFWWITDIFNGSAGPADFIYFLQYMALLCRLLSMLADLTTAAFVYNSWLSKFVVNLLAFFLFSHVVGSLWYYFAANKIGECLNFACGEPWCYKYTICEYRNKNGNFDDDPTSWDKWKNYDAAGCFGLGDYDFGIFEKAVSLMNRSSWAVRYIYSLFWGFQQIGTMAGNQIPSFFVDEILFTMFITATGLLLFSLLIGNIQNFLQALGRRKLEMSVRGLDIEQWMRHRRFPEEVKSQIRESEQYNWLTSRGVDELMLMKNLPEDLQRDIRRHVFKFDKKFPTIALMDEVILDAIRERMTQKTYIKDGKFLIRGGLLDKMAFIVQGRLESIGEDEKVVNLGEGDVCGEELVTLCLEHYVLNRNGGKFSIPAQKLLSKRTISCLTNVEAFTLRAADLEEVFSLYSGLLVNNPLVQGAIKKESVYPGSHLRSKSF